jgi:beta-1,4-N-acetylglucosaminyltransferase
MADHYSDLSVSQREQARVFVTVGNATQGFPRLLHAADEHLGVTLRASHSAFIQAGTTPGYTPRHCAWAPVVPLQKFEELIRSAEIIICHAGAGTLIHVFTAGKVPVVMPRRRKYGEVVDDHQMELTHALAAHGRVIPAWEPQDLPAALAAAAGSRTTTRQLADSRLLDLVRHDIVALSR